MLNSIYNQKITILNKLKATDNPDKVDTWQKTVVENASWYKRIERTVTSSGVVLGSYITCLIPYNENYMEYDEWKSLTDKTGKYTMSSGDYLIKGEVEEEITSKNVVSVIKQYSSNSCSVKQFQELYDRFGTYVQLSVEGV
jgi:hypothetical protein